MIGKHVAEAMQAAITDNLDRDLWRLQLDEFQRALDRIKAFYEDLERRYPWLKEP